MVYLIYNQHEGLAPIQLCVRCNPSTLFSRAAAQVSIPSHHRATASPHTGLSAASFYTLGRGGARAHIWSGVEKLLSNKVFHWLRALSVARRALPLFPAAVRARRLSYEARLLLLTLSFQRSRSCGLCQGSLYPPHQRTGLVCLRHENMHFPG